MPGAPRSYVVETKRVLHRVSGESAAKNLALDFSADKQQGDMRCSVLIARRPFLQSNAWWGTLAPMVVTILQEIEDPLRHLYLELDNPPRFGSRLLCYLLPVG